MADHQVNADITNENSRAAAELRKKQQERIKAIREAKGKYKPGYSTMQPRKKKPIVSKKSIREAEKKAAAEE